MNDVLLMKVGVDFTSIDRLRSTPVRVYYLQIIINYGNCTVFLYRVFYGDRGDYRVRHVVCSVEPARVRGDAPLRL